MFQASPTLPLDYDRSLEKEKQQVGEVENGFGLGIHVDGTPLLERKPSAGLSIAMDHQPASSTALAQMWGPQPMNRSASSPSLSFSPLSTASASNMYRPSSLRRKSSPSLRLDSAYISDKDSVSSSLPVKQPSPIHELLHFPPRRRPSLDSVPLTPDSTQVNDGHGPQQSYPAFINRPLKRSISQNSTSTFRSNISAAPPTIPPLDLRPNFQSTLAFPRQGPRTNKVSVIYEDGSSARTASFITAPSVRTSEGDPLVISGDYAASNTGDTDIEAAEDVRTTGDFPEGLYEIDLGAESQSSVATGWLKGVSFGSDRFVLPPVERQRLPVTSACMLFWLGFLGPWCWLIGGWLLSTSGSGQNGETALRPHSALVVEKREEESQRSRWRQGCKEARI
ncbi:hypothetical protein A0H81_03226 [Grifola frondosa]|uniref:Uncharacterized protein n=1 Tax=Grifola frondosa TaxID=5627 RepID=A0A1C7MP21_GRIFR|nr:hypothetical protein A0H81_03226 [Grifola frondosa]